MFFSSAQVTSLETLQEYLASNHICSSLILDFISHLITMVQNIGQENISKTFLLREAEFYEKEIELSVKRFIAKRVYAFHRKNLFSSLEERLQYFPASTKVPTDILVKILILEKVSRSSFIIPTTPEQTNFSLKSNEINTDTPLESKPKVVDKKTKKSIRVPVVKTEIDYSYSSEKSRADLDVVEKTHHNKIQQHFAFLQSIKVEKISLCSMSKEFLNDISNVKYPHLSKWIQKYILKTQDKQNKYVWMRLKHVVLSHEKLIQKIETIQFVINEGNSSIDVLQIASEITDNKEINTKLYEYFENLLRLELEQHLSQFRRALECCYNRYDVLFLLAQYPLKNTSCIGKYNLDVIPNIKTIVENSSTKKEFEKFANTYLGNKDNNIKKAIYTSLFESPVIDKIWDAMQQAQSINDFFSCLKQLQKIPETNKVATTIFHLAVTFLRAKQKISFVDLEISLNFIPDFLRNHTVRIITRKLQQDINFKTEAILRKNVSIEKQWKNLLRLLNHEQYNGAKVKILNYSREELLARLQKISGTDGDIEKIVEHELGSNIDESLRMLIITKHSHEIEKKNKTPRNFFRELKDLIASQEKNLSLRRPLIDLLSSYGNINFAVTDSITGYDLASSISMYYNNSARTTISLPGNLEKNIASLLEENINEERLRQLNKLKS